jgi:hypothetical protein
LDSNEEPYYIQIDLTQEKIKNNFRAYVKVEKTENDRILNSDHNPSAADKKVILKIPRSIIPMQLSNKNQI